MAPALRFQGAASLWQDQRDVSFLVICDTNSALTPSPPMMTTQRRGFTLIELLIVVVIIGILAAIAIPKFQNTKGKANAAALKSDLRNLATAQEAYFYDNAVYASSASVLSYSKSPGVVLSITTATASGWSAIATHPASYPLTCALYQGNVAAQTPATVEGLIGCQ